MMKKGQQVDISLGMWRGTPPTADGRTSGMRLTVMEEDGTRTLLQLELSVEQLGRLVAGQDCKATVERI